MFLLRNVTFFAVFCLSWLMAQTLAAAEQPTFEEWLADFQQEAMADGISPGTVARAFAGVRYNQGVIKKDRNQPEFTLTLEAYLGRTVSPARVAKGKELLWKHRLLLSEIAARYGVPPQYLVAFWGLETDFGRVTGGYPIIESLATLTYDPRRSDFFKRELLAALHIVEDGLIPLGQMEGSWAGAMGYLQFLPSVFRKYGVDDNRDGRIEIWQAGPDLFASAANFLAASGWQPGWRWGREVQVPAPLDANLLGLGKRRGVGGWQELGVRRLGGGDLPPVRLDASLVRPDTDANRFFLVYDNFRVILRWNRSAYYAVAVGTLADQLME